MYLNDNSNFIIQYLNRTRYNYLNLFNNWLDSKKDYNILSIAARDVNTRFNQLIKPSNPFCKTNFIDFNFVVDQILQMSIPYNETKNHHSIHHTELSKFSFQNEIGAKINIISNSGFCNSQNSILQKSLTNNNTFLNHPKNLSTKIQNDFPTVENRNHLLNQNEKNSLKPAPNYHNDNSNNNKLIEITRNGSN